MKLHFVMRLRYSLLIAEEKRFAKCKAMQRHFVSLSHLRKQIQNYQGCHCFQVKGPCGVKVKSLKVRKNFVLVFVLSTRYLVLFAQSTHHLDLEESCHLLCSPATCPISTSQFSMKSLTSLILAIASVG